jgi:hypothetical protein
MPKTTSPHPDDIADVQKKLTSSDIETLKLAKDIASFAYGEERKKTDVIEGRAFGLMQFAKVGLTIIAGIAGLISNASIHDTPFRESLILLLATASAYLAKLFWRGTMVVRVGYSAKPHKDFHVKPDQFDVYATQEASSYVDALKANIANMVLYLESTAIFNQQRIYQCKCCYVNTFGFLVAFFLFFALSLIHLFQANFTLLLPEHRLIGGCIFLLALVTDWMVEKIGIKWFNQE